MKRESDEARDELAEVRANYATFVRLADARCARLEANLAAARTKLEHLAPLEVAAAQYRAAYAREKESDDTDVRHARFNAEYALLRIAREEKGE